jgi:hypothetical protein
MKKGAKNIAIVVLLLIIAGVTIIYFVWNKPRRNVEREQGIEVTAAQIVKDFQTNEADANKKYLDKAIQVTGLITEVKENQDGNMTITLASDDAFTGVFCTLKEKSVGLSTGSRVVIKGICSGMLTDVRLREAVVVK